MTELVDYIKPEDRETYDYIFNAASAITSDYDQSSMVYQMGVLLFVIINQWEKGILRDIETISQALTVSTAFWEFKGWATDNTDLFDKVEELLMQQSETKDAQEPS